MFILIISIVVWVVSGSFLMTISALGFMLFLKVGFNLIDALLSNKETGGILTLLGLAWLIGSDGSDVDVTENIDLADSDIEDNSSQNDIDSDDYNS